MSKKNGELPHTGLDNMRKLMEGMRAESSLVLGYLENQVAYLQNLQLTIGEQLNALAVVQDFVKQQQRVLAGLSAHFDCTANRKELALSKK